MKFAVICEEQFQVYECAERHINISVRSPGTPIPSISKEANSLATLYLEFHDIVDPALDGKSMSEVLGHPCKGNIIAPKAEHAKQIVEFFKQWEDKVTLVVVNCVAGRSRSAGIAAALSVVAGGEDNFIFSNKKYQPNILIYRLIMNEAFGNGTQN